MMMTTYHQSCAQSAYLARIRMMSHRTRDSQSGQGIVFAVAYHGISYYSSDGSLWKGRKRKRWRRM